MFRINKLTKSTGATLLCATLIAACSPAGYEIVRDRGTSTTGNPNNIVADAPPPDEGVVANLPPTARLEAIKDGYSITMVRVGMGITLRPSLDTLDADDVGRSSCTNPGIVRAAYDVGGLGSPTVVRTQGCESLGVPWTFQTPGVVTVSLVVTSNENETARAQLTLIVTSGAADEVNGGGLTISAVPMIQIVGREITFTSRCEAAGTVRTTWNFGDSRSGEGRETRHRYQAQGQYEVRATCTSSTGRTFVAVVTVVVVPEGTRLPEGPPVLPIPPRGTPGISPPNQSPPGQQPNQGGAAQN